jgi:hypothetical protein
MAEQCETRAAAVRCATLLLAAHDKPAVVEIIANLGDDAREYWAVSSSDDLDTVKGMVVGITILSKADATI